MNEYYNKIESYYDSDAGDFDHRYWQNPVLQKIRQAFREEVYLHDFKDILEIGYGTGLDMAHFAMNFENASVAGIDISGEMKDIASQRFEGLGIVNAKAEQGSVEDLTTLYPDRKFDVIYVFFGALNTVEDLDLAAREIRKSLQDDGTLVLTFVNKWFIAGILIELLKGRFKAAFARLRKVWGGYSPDIFLPSRCYSPRQIQRAFEGFRLIRKRGFSILHPAWYYHGLNRAIPTRILHLLWRIDIVLSKTPLWCMGEYALYVFEVREDAF